MTEKRTWGIPLEMVIAADSKEQALEQFHAWLKGMDYTPLNGWRTFGVATLERDPSWDEAIRTFEYERISTTHLKRFIKEVAHPAEKAITLVDNRGQFTPSRRWILKIGGIDIYLNEKGYFYAAEGKGHIWNRTNKNWTLDDVLRTMASTLGKK